MARRFSGVRAFRALVFGLCLTLAGMAGALAGTAEPWQEKAPDSIRIATFNAGLVRKGAGMLVNEMTKGSPQIDAVAEIILRVRPDILVLNKFDRDPARRALVGFAERLRAGPGRARRAGLPFPLSGTGQYRSAIGI
jgi:hypothetical protein